MQFGYVDQGLSETANLQKQFNINTYAPTMLVFKENIDKPADIIQVNHCNREYEEKKYYSELFFIETNLTLFLIYVVMFVLCRLKE